MKTGILKIAMGQQIFEERYATLQEAEAVRSRYVEQAKRDGYLQIADGTRLEGTITLHAAEIQVTVQSLVDLKGDEHGA